MHFVLEKKDFSRDRFRMASPMFVVLWLSVMAALGFFLHGAESHLKDQELSEVRNRLSLYIEDTLSYPKTNIFRQPVSDRNLHGLSFVRLVVPGEHVLLTQGTKEQLDFTHLVNIDAEVSGAWLYLGGSAEDIWSIVSITHKSEVTIQGGRKSNFYQAMYVRLQNYCMLAGFVSFVLLWLPALFVVKQGIAPLVLLKDKIQRSVQSGHGDIQFEMKGGSLEVEQLYEQLNQLFCQNRSLIQEMQASLDNVAHDLRTPMTRLRSVAEYGLQAHSDEEKLRESLSDCLEESERVLSMLRVMMSVAEAESGTMRLEREPVDLEEMLQDVVSLYEYVAEDKRVSLSCTIGKTGTVLGDKTRLSQVFANLVDNGIKYSQEGGKVSLRLNVENGVVTISVEDNGMGISENEMDRIWERLYRGDRSRSEKGLGLGLNYVKAVVEAHAGEVRVSSKLQLGSLFSVRLPLHEQDLLEEGAATTMK